MDMTKESGVYSHSEHKKKIHDLLGESSSKVIDLINSFKYSFKRIDLDQRLSTVGWLIIACKYEVSHVLLLIVHPFLTSLLPNVKRTK